MVEHLRDKDGKFAGSVGSGKKNVPTAASTRAGIKSNKNKTPEKDHTVEEAATRFAGVRDLGPRAPLPPRPVLPDTFQPFETHCSRPECGHRLAIDSPEALRVEDWADYTGDNETVLVVDCPACGKSAKVEQYHGRFGNPRELAYSLSHIGASINGLNYNISLDDREAAFQRMLASGKLSLQRQREMRGDPTWMPGN